MSEKSRNMTITQILATFNEGGTLEDLGTELRLAVAACQSTGKKAQVKLVIDITKNGGAAVNTVEKISSTIPKPDPAATTFYVTEDAGLSLRDPRQPQLLEVAQ